MRLAHDRSVGVRWCLTTLRSVPDEVLEVLRHDNHEDVRANVGSGVRR
jgi:hypothetical protein